MKTTSAPTTLPPALAAFSARSTHQARLGHSTSRAFDSGGFTLVEVLVALVIVSLVLAAALRAGGTMIVTQEALKRATLGGWSAENRLAEIRLARVWPPLGTSEAPCPQAELALACVVDVRTTPNSAIRRIDVRVVDANDRARQAAHRIAFQSSLP